MISMVYIPTYLSIESSLVLPHIASDGNQTLNFDVFKAELRSLVTNKEEPRL